MLINQCLKKFSVFFLCFLVKKNVKFRFWSWHLCRTNPISITTINFFVSRCHACILPRFKSLAMSRIVKLLYMEIKWTQSHWQSLGFISLTVKRKHFCDVMWMQKLISWLWELKVQSLQCVAFLSRTILALKVSVRNRNRVFLINLNTFL